MFQLGCCHCVGHTLCVSMDDEKPEAEGASIAGSMSCCTARLAALCCICGAMVGSLVIVGVGSLLGAVTAKQVSKYTRGFSSAVCRRWFLSSWHTWGPDGAVHFPPG